MDDREMTQDERVGFAIRTGIERAASGKTEACFIDMKQRFAGPTVTDTSVSSVISALKEHGENGLAIVSAGLYDDPGKVLSVMLPLVAFHKTSIFLSIKGFEGPGRGDMIKASAWIREFIECGGMVMLAFESEFEQLATSCPSAIGKVRAAILSGLVKLDPENGVSPIQISYLECEYMDAAKRSLTSVIESARDRMEGGS